MKRIILRILLKCHIDIELYKWWILHWFCELIYRAYSRYYRVSLSKDWSGPENRGQSWWASFGIDTYASLEHMRYIFSREKVYLIRKYVRIMDGHQGR